MLYCQNVQTHVLKVKVLKDAISLSGGKFQRKCRFAPLSPFSANDTNKKLRSKKLR